MKVTVKELIQMLESCEQGKQVMFGGDPDGLEFYRVKDRGDYVQIEFDQQVYRNSHGQLIVEEFE